MMALISLNLAMLMYFMYVRPFELAAQNDLEIFNQVVTFVTAYSLYVFCDINND